MTDLLLQPYFNTSRALPTLTYNRLLFSPSGRYLAVHLENDNKGSAHEVWIIDLKKNTARRITEGGMGKKFRIYSDKIRWESNEMLLVAAEKLDEKHGWVDEYQLIHASMGHSFIEKFDRSDSLRKHFELVPRHSKYYQLSFKTTFAVLKNLSSGKISRFKMKNFYPDDSSYLLWTADEKFFSFAYNHGHGMFSLYAGITMPKFVIKEIAQGGWEMAEYAFSPRGAQIAFPSSEHNSINIFDFAKQQIVRQIRTGWWPGNIGWSSTNTLAFISVNCSKKFPPFRGNRPWDYTRLYIFQM